MSVALQPLTIPRSPRRSGVRLRRALVGAVVVLGVVATTVPAGPASAQQAPAEAVAPAMDRLTVAVDAVVAAEQARNGARTVLDDAVQAEASARAHAEAARAEFATQRRLYGDLSAASYVRHGVASPRDHQVMVGALAGRRTMLIEAAERRDAADAALEEATSALVAARAAFEAAETARQAAEDERIAAELAADEALFAVGATDLPAIAYLAYRRAADEANAADPECRLPAAVLAGMGRVRWRHGRPTGPTADLIVEAPAPGEPAGAYDLGPVVTPLAAELCAGDRTLDRHNPLQAAVYDVERDSARVRIILATARRYARTPGLELGDVPADPAVIADGIPQFDDGSPPLFPGDVTGMIDWAMTRLGTPYSQCLGPEARPQDPICPPGTNRFGAGFFDCSGFVSSAYRKIGVVVPATTYAMDADPAFMATRVANRFDLALMQPGDVFLMDGHTGMYVGNGQIIHTSGGGLTLEPVPRWVAHATYAVLRPADLLGTMPIPA
jgi:cell wall-associated NlpC family hydrolase